MQQPDNKARNGGGTAVLQGFRTAFTGTRGSGLTRAEGARLRFGVRVGEWHFLIAPDTLSEVVTRPELYPLPHTPRWFLGLLNQRGNVLPVFDLHQVLQISAPEHGPRAVLVFDQSSEAVGMRIDGLPQSVRLEQHVRPVPPVPALLSAHIGAAYRAGQSTWLEFVHQTFFSMLGAQMTGAPDLPVGT